MYDLILFLLLIKNPLINKIIFKNGTISGQLLTILKKKNDLETQLNLVLFY